MSVKLNILVPVKRVIDFAIKPRINKAGTGIEKTGVKFSINPFCDIAVSISTLGFFRPTTNNSYRSRKLSVSERRIRA
jgi:hypothetical protein